LPYFKGLCKLEKLFWKLFSADASEDFRIDLGVDWPEQLEYLRSLLLMRTLFKLIIID
jgi:hypothetical protein